MNLGINTPSMMNQNMNCSRRRNTPNFGMAIKLDKTAAPIIKKQIVSMGEKSKNNFIEKLKQAVTRQQDNPVNIMIRKANRRQALVAEIVDSPAGKDLGGVKNQTTSQPFIGKNGSLKFLNKAEKKANQINETNNQVADLINNIPEAEAADYGLTK